MLYQARGIRDSSRTNFVWRGSDGAMAGLLSGVVRAPATRGRDEEPSVPYDPRATDVGSCSRDGILRWRADDRPGYRVGRPRGHGGARCRDDPSPACRLCGDRPCRPMPSGRAPSHGRPSACPGRRTRASGRARRRLRWGLGGLRGGGPGRVADDDRDRSRGGRSRRLRHDRHGRDRRRLCRGSRRRRDGWSRRLLPTRSPGRKGAGGCRVDGRSGRRRRETVGPGAVGAVVATPVPEVGTAPIPGVGAGADNP